MKTEQRQQTIQVLNVHIGLTQTSTMGMEPNIHYKEYVRNIKTRIASGKKTTGGE